MAKFYKACLLVGLIFLLISVLSLSAQAYTINEPLNEYEFNHWRLNITFDSTTERNAIWTKISSRKVPNIVNFSYRNIGGLTYIVEASLKDYRQRYNRLCDTCSSWYLNASWETIQVYDVSNGCVYCIANISTPYNSSDRWINMSDYTDLAHWNNTANLVYINLTGTGQVGKAVNNSNYYTSASNINTTFNFSRDFEGGSHDFTLEGGASLSVLSGASSNKTGVYGARHSATSGGAGEESYKSFNAIDRAIYEWDMRSPDVIDDVYTFLTKTAGAADANRILIGFRDNKIVSLNDATFQSLRSATANTWYHIKLITYASNNSFDIWIDDTIACKGCADNGATSPSVSAFSIFRGGIVNTIDIDNFIQYKYASPEPSLSYNTTQYYTPINITSWGNNYTNNQSLSFTIYENVSKVVSFNVTANQTVDTYSWSLNGTNQSNNSASFIYLFSENGLFFINASVYNASYNSYAFKNWTINYTFNIPIPPTNYSVSGYVKIEDGTPLEDATVGYSGGSNLSNGMGFYNLTGILNGTYIFTASRGGYSSLSKNITINGADLNNQNFTLIVSSNNTEILAAISNMNSSLRSYVQEQSSDAGAMGFIGSIIGAAFVIGVLKRRRTS